MLFLGLHDVPLFAASILVVAELSILQVFSSVALALVTGAVVQLSGCGTLACSHLFSPALARRPEGCIWRHGQKTPFLG